MKACLIRVGIDQAFGKWNAPIDPETNDFAYVPIPEQEGTEFQPGMAGTYAPFRDALAAFASSHPGADAGTCVAPDALASAHPHLDPDFERLTYGDDGLRRGKGLCDLVAGDLLVFYAGLRPTRPCEHRLVYALIGALRVAEVVRVRDVPRSRWSENAHTRRRDHEPDDVIVRGQPGESGRLRRAIPIGEFRDGAYRVRLDVLDAWGGLSCRDGFIQRSAVPPAFRDTSRFLSWFQDQSPEFVAANSLPARSSPVAARPPRRTGGRRTPSPQAPEPLDARIILVHLRQPRRHDQTESRTDPLYEFGSFGLTGCHGCNLLRNDRVAGARLGFVQPGPGAMRLVLLTPPVCIVDHGQRREATWAPAEMPLRFDDGVLLIDADGKSEIPTVRQLLSRTRRSTWLARFSSRFRSRTSSLDERTAAELLEAWDRRTAGPAAPARATVYWDALPFPPPKPDTNRGATRRRLLAEARDGKSRLRGRCR